MYCPDVLCNGRKVGTMFRLSNAKPSSYVTCTNAGSVCRRCKEPLVFDTKNTACVNDYHGSKQTDTGENCRSGRKWKIQQTVLTTTLTTVQTDEVMIIF